MTDHQDHDQDHDGEHQDHADDRPETGRAPRLPSAPTPEYGAPWLPISSPRDRK
jgi:hypothetical protein